MVRTADDELLRSFHSAPIPHAEIRVDEPLSAHTRFAIGGPADVFVIAAGADALVEALARVKTTGLPSLVIGGGTNLVVADSGFRGVVLQYATDGIEISPGGLVRADSGAILQTLVDRTVASGLRGLHTMTGIPGWVGGAVYGNAGAYGHSICESIGRVRFFDGERVQAFSNSECRFAYRESLFKRHKDWIILDCDLQMDSADPAEIKNIAGGILRVRNEKYPPAMKCAGSIFKNLLFAELPPRIQELLPDRVVREGKVPSAWFLEQTGVKGIRRGDIQVAAYHANLIYNDGNGTARDLVAVIRELKTRVLDHFGIALEEEVQYVGEFDGLK